MPTDLQVRLAAVPVNVAVARRLVREWSEANGAGARQVEDIMLAVTEAVANVVRHAYPAAEPGDVWLTGHTEDGMLVVSIRDIGVGPAHPSPAPGLGVGLPIIVEVADHSTLHPTTAGTHLTIRFRLA